MKLYKKDFTQEKYLKLYNYAESIKGIIVDKGDYYEVEIITKTLEELKLEKIKTLKELRIAYKKTIQINENYTYWDCDAENNIYQYLNIDSLLNGFIEEEKTLFIQYTNEIISKYNFYKLQINNASSEEELNLINIEF